MRRFILPVMILLLCVLLCSCGENPQPDESSATQVAMTEAQQLHTIAPTELEPQLEWCPVEDCKLYFNDSDGVTVLNERDIRMFALSGNDDNAQLIFNLSDEAKTMMEAAESTESFAVVLNEEEIGTAYFSADKENLTLSGLGFEKLCEISGTIRGFE